MYSVLLFCVYNEFFKSNNIGLISLLRCCLSNIINCFVHTHCECLLRCLFKGLFSGVFLRIRAKFLKESRNWPFTHTTMTTAPCILHAYMAILYIKDIFGIYPELPVSMCGCLNISNYFTIIYIQFSHAFVKKLKYVGSFKDIKGVFRKSHK